MHSYPYSAMDRVHPPISIMAELLNGSIIQAIDALIADALNHGVTLSALPNDQLKTLDPKTYGGVLEEGDVVLSWQYSTGSVSHAGIHRLYIEPQNCSLWSVCTTDDGSGEIAEGSNDEGKVSFALWLRTLRGQVAKMRNLPLDRTF